MEVVCCSKLKDASKGCLQNWKTERESCLQKRMIICRIILVNSIKKGFGWSWRGQTWLCCESNIKHVWACLLLLHDWYISCASVQTWKNINILEHLPTSCQWRNSFKCNLNIGEQCVYGTLPEFCRKDEHIYARFPSAFYLAELGKNSRYSRAVYVRLVGTLQFWVYSACLLSDLRIWCLSRLHSQILQKALRLYLPHG